MAMRVALYARVSPQRQAQAQTVEQQIEHLTGHARQQGLDVPRDQCVFHVMVGGDSTASWA
jgi:DNA invertase Pin-like site-specific DNA recombinase